MILLANVGCLEWERVKFTFQDRSEDSQFPLILAEYHFPQSISRVE